MFGGEVGEPHDLHHLGHGDLSVVSKFALIDDDAVAQHPGDVIANAGTHRGVADNQGHTDRRVGGIEQVRALIDRRCNQQAAIGAPLYRQPIRLDGVLAGLSLPQSVLRSLSVLVIINTALAHHLLAASYRTTGNQLGTPSMKRAIALYETALQTQAQQMAMLAGLKASIAAY